MWAVPSPGQLTQLLGLPLLPWAPQARRLLQPQKSGTIWKSERQSLGLYSCEGGPSSFPSSLSCRLEQDSQAGGHQEGQPVGAGLYC